MKNKLGFTLIEMIVVVGVIALALPAVFAIIFGVVREQAKVYAIKQAKREGDFALDAIQNTIKNYASGIYSDQALQKPVCNTSGSNYSNKLYFGSNIAANAWFEYELDSNNKIASNSSVASAITNLTTQQVSISNLTISCNRTATFSPALVAVSFDVKYNTPSTFQENQATLHYSTQIKLTNY